MYALVILAVINTGVAVFYYLKMVRASYSSVPSSMPRIRLKFSTTLLGIFFIVIILYLGTFPQGFLDFAKEAVAAAI
jgi:NADH-quinone oxidoreductase subunit N